MTSVTPELCARYGAWFRCAGDSRCGGGWRDEVIFVVEENLALYGVSQTKIERCDQPIGQHLKSMPAQIEGDENPLPKPRKGKRPHGYSPAFDLRSELYRVTGTSRCL